VRKPARQFAGSIRIGPSLLSPVRSKNPCWPEALLITNYIIRSVSRALVGVGWLQITHITGAGGQYRKSCAPGELSRVYDRRASVNRDLFGHSVRG
jgi:hypothetical protein